jgi:hypothetical protein
VEGGGDRLDGRGSGGSGEEEHLAIERALGDSPYCDARDAVPEDEIGKQSAGAGGPDHFDEDQEVVGRVAEVWLEAAEFPASADLHLAMTGAWLASAPSGIGELCHLDLVGGRERMCFGQDQAYVFTHERLPGQVAMDGTRLTGVLVADDSVELAQPKGRYCLFNLYFGHLDADVGMASIEFSNRRRHDAQEGGLESSHPYYARRVPSGDRGHLCLGRLHSVEQRGRVADQCAAGVGESHVPAGTFEQLRACLAFEHRELLGDRARRVTEGPGGAVNSSASIEFAEQAEASEIQHRSQMLPSFMHKEEIDLNS